MPFIEWQAVPRPDPAQDAPLTGGVPLVFFAPTAGYAKPVWQLTTGFAYRARDGRYLAVPAHTGSPREPGHSTDLASVPTFLWGVLAPYGRQLRAALLHDHRCDVAAGKLDEDPQDLDADGHAVPAGRTPERVRHEADDLFREALAADGVGLVRRWLFWTGVSVGRLASYARVRLILLVIPVLALPFLAYRAIAIALGGGPPGLDAFVGSWAFPLAAVAVAAVLAVVRWWAQLLLVPGLVYLLLAVAGTGPDAPRWWLHSLVLVGVAAAAALGLALGAGAVAGEVRLGLVAAVAAPIVAPVVLVTYTAQVLLNLPDRIGSIASGAHGSPTGTDPTLTPLGGE